MAINVTFNGATIYKPGAYSEELIDLGGGFPVGPTGLVAIFGEAPSGPPGSSISDISTNVYSPDELPAIVSLYGNGDIADACSFLFAPGADGAIPGGAQQIYIYKTNESTQASVAMANNFGTLTAQVWGTGGNLITYQDVAVPAQPAQTTSVSPFNLTGAPFDQIVSGSPHLDDALATEAQENALSAFTSLGTESATPISATLDGQTLVPGVYSTGAASLAASGNGTLTFNGAGVYVIQCASTLVTGAGGIPTMTLENGATAANIFWIVGSSATINSGVSSAAAVFQGNILADVSISVSQTATINGSMVALTGSITYAAAAQVHSQAASVLGAAGSFAALASASITNTGASNFYGNVGTSPGSSVTLGGGTIVAGAGLTLVLRINGASSALDNTFTLPSGVVSTALLQSALNSSGNWSLGLPSGMTFTVSGTNVAAFLNIAQGLGVNPQYNGHGQNFQLVSGSLLAPINIAAGLYTSETEDMAVITINNTGTLTVESGTVGGQIMLDIGRVGGGNVAPVVTVNATNMLLINNSVIEYSIPLANFTSMYTLVQFINGSTTGLWSAQLASTLTGQLPANSLDQVSNVGANSINGSLPAQIKDDAYAVRQFLSQSANVTLIQASGQGVAGLPAVQGPIYLAGGLLGGTLSADVVNALTSISAVHINSVVPLFSRDASADILDMLTDPSSDYTIDAIHQAVKTFLSMQATTKAKNECQGYLSLKDTYANCKLESQNLADSRIQLVIQDIRQVDSYGNITWFEPWAGACLLAGARGGSPVGLPMTFKYFNLSGIRQTAQPMTTPEAQIVNGFNPQTQYDDAIMNGITFWEKPLTGGYRLVVDNTTYGADDDWVYNRANVQYAADVLAYDFRSQLENIYVGVKNTVSAAEVKSTCDSILTSYLAQGITVSTSDAPSGYKQLVVQIVGNTINISVVVKLVEGIDFILATITLQRASSIA